MTVDTSALVAILFAEPEQHVFAQRLAEAEVARISVANLLELTLVVEGQAGREAADHIETLIRRTKMIVEPVTLEHGELTRQAFRSFGKGKHKAGLNFGDCFAYALAKAVGEPLLYKGSDFSRTDIQSAL